MTTLTPAPRRLVLKKSEIQFERGKTNVALIDSYTGTVEFRIPEEEWTEVANFFRDISAPGALL